MAWTDGLPQDVITHVQKTGWDKLSGDDAAKAAAKSHLEAQNYIGAPADKLIRIPTDATDPAWRTIWQRLGAKGDAKEYDFSDVKFSDGTPAETGFVSKMQAFAVANGVPLAHAKGLVSEFVKYLDEAATSEKTTADATLKAARDGLTKEWGANHQLNLEHAKRAATALGIKPETITALEQHIGYADVMKMMHSIGTKIGEDKWVGGNPGGTPSMTKEQAIERLTALKADEAWREKVLKGDVEGNKEIAALNTIIAGDDTAESFARAGK